MCTGSTRPPARASERADASTPPPAGEGKGEWALAKASIIDDSPSHPHPNPLPPRGRGSGFDEPLAVPVVDRASWRRPSGAREHAQAFRLGAAHQLPAPSNATKLSADGAPFLLHDATLDRTTRERGVAGLRPWSELSRIDAGGWLNRHYAGEPLPSLQAVATYMQRNGFLLDLEIKPTPGSERATGVAVALACREMWNGGNPRRRRRPRSVPKRCSARARLRPNCRARCCSMLWNGRRSSPAQTLGCVAVVTNYALMDAALIGQLHTAGLRALCYTVNDTAEARRRRSRFDGGIDGLITDAVDRFSPMRGGVRLRARVAH
ncbi:MAG: glycerophosphodiester phosphodiesterase family protein [Rubrivivax sp.]